MKEIEKITSWEDADQALSHLALCRRRRSRAAHAGARA